MTNIGQFLKEVKVELSKVNWPTRQQTIQYTMVVLGMSAVFALFLGLLDFGFQKLLNILITR